MIQSVLGVHSFRGVNLPPTFGRKEPSIAQQIQQAIEKDEFYNERPRASKDELPKTRAQQSAAPAFGRAWWEKTTPAMDKALRDKWAFTDEEMMKLTRAKENPDWMLPSWALIKRRKQRRATKAAGKAQQGSLF